MDNKEIAITVVSKVTGVSPEPSMTTVDFRYWK